MIKRILIILFFFQFFVYGQITFESYNRAQASSSSITVNKPSGVTSGDLLIIFCYQEIYGTYAAPTGLTGWTQTGQYSGTPTVRVPISIFYRIADGTEGASETLTFSGSARDVAWYFRISGIDATTPIDVSGVADNVGGSTSYTVPGVTTTTNNALALAFLGAWGGGGYPFTTATSGWSVDYTTQYGTQAYVPSDAIASKVISTAGATGDMTLDGNAATSYANYVMIAIAPASGGSSGWIGLINGVTPTAINGKAVSGISKVIGK